MRALFMAAMMLGLALSACIATETGNPTFTGTSTADTTMLDGIVLPDSPATVTSYISIEGGPGAISPAAGEAWVFNLDEQAPDDYPPGVAPVAADGSFRVELPANAGDTLRLHVVSADGVVVSEPVDLSVDAEGLSLLERGCAFASPSVLTMAEGATAVVRIDNGCDATLRVGPGQLLDGDGYTFEPVDALDIPTGDSRDIWVTRREASAPVILRLPSEGTERQAVSVTLSPR